MKFIFNFVTCVCESRFIYYQIFVSVRNMISIRCTDNKNLVCMCTLSYKQPRYTHVCIYHQIPFHCVVHLPKMWGWVIIVIRLAGGGSRKEMNLCSVRHSSKLWRACFSPNDDGC